jgi:hypothetical protein
MSLPPFAQAFSMNALTLPPIDVVGKKRTRNSASRDDGDPSDSESVSLLVFLVFLSQYIYKVQIFG